MNATAQESSPETVVAASAGRAPLGAPILICGYPKSGTTLLTSLLDGHPELVVFPEETFYLRHVHQNPNEAPEASAAWLRKVALRYLGLGEAEGSFGNVDYREFDHEAFIERYDRRSERRSGLGLLEAVVESFAETAGQTGRKYWVEKSPGNEHDLPIAAERWPDLRPIFITRDPRDVYLSYAKKRNGDGRGLDVGKFVTGWAGTVAAWQQYRTAGNPGLLVRYEDLVAHPRLTLERVCSYLGIEYAEQLDQPTKNGAPWFGNSMHGQKFTKVATDASGRWKGRLDEVDRRTLEWALGKAMTWLDYETDSPSISFSEWRRFVGQARLKKLLPYLLRLHWPVLQGPASYASLENVLRRLTLKKPLRPMPRVAGE